MDLLNQVHTFKYSLFNCRGIIQGITIDIDFESEMNCQKNCRFKKKGVELLLLFLERDIR